MTILWCSSPRSLTGCSSSTSASAILASALASFLSFLVFDSVIMRSLDGFATRALKPISAAVLAIQRQWVPVSNTRGADLSCVDRKARNPSGVVGIVVSLTTHGLSDAFDMTQIFVALSLTSAPIMV